MVANIQHPAPLSFYPGSSSEVLCPLLAWRVLLTSEKVTLKNFTIFTGIYLCWSLFLKTCNFIKKRLQHKCFPVNIAKFSRTPILKNNCKRLLLITYKICFLKNVLFRWFPYGRHCLIFVRSLNLKEDWQKELFFDILFSLRNNDKEKKLHLKIFIHSRDNCN